MINVFQPSLGQEELTAIKQVFDSNWIGKGLRTGRFEREFADYLGVNVANIKSVSCCTAGLFLIMELLDIKGGDEVILPTISFVGAANAIGSRGAKIVFCDVDEKTLNARLIDIEKNTTKNTKAVILIHYGGVPVQNMDAIIKFCKERNIALIEDNACSVASQYNGKHCGTLADFGVFSFDAMKILVIGDGGMIYCKNECDAEKIEKLGYLGLETKSGMTNKSDNKWWEFDISSFGNRQIINDITAAIGTEQLKKLNGFIERRRQIHEIYNKELSNVTWIKLCPDIPDNVRSSYYFYWIQTEFRDELASHLKKNGIYTTFRYYPLHKVKYYNSSDTLPNSEKASETTLCIPIHQSLSDEDVMKIIGEIRKFKHESA